MMWCQPVSFGIEGRREGGNKLLQHFIQGDGGVWMTEWYNMAELLNIKCLDPARIKNDNYQFITMQQGPAAQTPELRRASTFSLLHPCTPAEFANQLQHMLYR
jgi:hypothetical protein